MPALLLYLLQVNVALALFYLAYHFILRRLTFYHLNRLFLVLGILFSSVYPFIDLSELMAEHEQIAGTYIGTLPAWAIPTSRVTQATAFDYWQLPVYLFWAGLLVMLARFILQFVSLYKIHNSSVLAKYKNTSFREVASISQAFSFWQTIYLDPSRHTPEELESILQHEVIHTTGWHTLDVLLAELSTVFYWFNPTVWLLKKAVKENLEFIADQQVVQAGIALKDYQYLLLKVVGASQPQIANQFNFPSLKRRIAMMNKKQSQLRQIARYAVLLPLMTVPVLVMTACSEEPEAAAPEAVQSHVSIQASIADSVVYYIDGVEAPNDAYKKLDPQEIHSVNVLKGESVKEAFPDKAGKSIIAITTKKNKESAQVLKFNRLLPVPPPPPPAPETAPARQAVSVTAELPPPPPPVSQDPNEPFIFSPANEGYYQNNLPEDYKAFLKRNPTVKQVGWKFNNRKDYTLESLVIFLKSGKTEAFDFDQNHRVPAAEAKYGELPQLPAPPPPVRSSGN
ncbi:M56 family metallopeptidase [Pontibacter liquoris]|uniref:M56 family metallopeptidase n=1 Tax=Pontibacter liquoris TaxID=2905677 RepID=UPI001FA7E9B3|nr:M56 family metallopeptidase [Pontibacter liquoris]